jgi:phenylacetate-CoA ligase
MSLEDRLYPFLSVYERMPRGVKHALGLSYRQLPENFRRGKRYRDFKQLAESGENWSREQIADYQWASLWKVLLHAQKHCPFYKKRFAEAAFDPAAMRDFSDLANCPMLTKQDLLNHRDAMLSDAFPSSERLYITTGGSTGVPVGFYLHKGVSRAKETAFLETIWKRGGYFDGARLALLRGYVTTEKVNGAISSYDATRDWLILSSYHLSRERLTEYLEELAAFKPDLLYVYPSSILALAEHLQNSGTPWTIPLQGILCGSERITEPQRNLIQSIFGCRAYSWYGHSERVVLAAEGRKSKHYYFLPQYGYVEFGPPTGDGLREVIGTSFDNFVMPLIRYRTGDYVRLVENSAALDSEPAARAPLEYPVPAAKEIAGREQEFLVSATGRKISLTAFNMHDAIFNDLYAVQFYQERPGLAEFRYMPSPKFESSRLPQIQTGIRRKLGDDFEVTFRPVTEVEKTPAGKHQWLVSRLERDKNLSHS